MRWRSSSSPSGRLGGKESELWKDQWFRDKRLRWDWIRGDSERLPGDGGSEEENEF